MVVSVNSQAPAFAALRKVGMFGGRDRKVQAANDRQSSHQPPDHEHEAPRPRREPAEAEGPRSVSHGRGR